MVERRVVPGEAAERVLVHAPEDDVVLLVREEDLEVELAEHQVRPHARDVLHDLVQRLVSHLVAVGVGEPQPLLQLRLDANMRVDVHVLHRHRVDEAALLDAPLHGLDLLKRALLQVRLLADGAAVPGLVGLPPLPLPLGVHALPALDLPAPSVLLERLVADHAADAEVLERHGARLGRIVPSVLLKPGRDGRDLGLGDLAQRVEQIGSELRLLLGQALVARLVDGVDGVPAVTVRRAPDHREDGDEHVLRDVRGAVAASVAPPVAELV
mmetsp:Transcript_47058/g.152740  ORF Transcript_47058/g.152740 Transcript_47058/m.152740 type:complete len:269 (+) Transcript_47058:1871-2677(+)